MHQNQIHMYIVHAYQSCEYKKRQVVKLHQGDSICTQINDLILKSCAATNPRNISSKLARTTNITLAWTKWHPMHQVFFSTFTKNTNGNLHEVLKRHYIMLPPSKFSNFFFKHFFSVTRQKGLGKRLKYWCVSFVFYMYVNTMILINVQIHIYGPIHIPNHINHWCLVNLSILYYESWK